MAERTKTVGEGPEGAVGGLQLRVVHKEEITPMSEADQESGDCPDQIEQQRGKAIGEVRFGRGGGLGHERVEFTASLHEAAEG